jgi:DNA-binding transcriptional ArsR family regulator
MFMHAALQAPLLALSEPHRMAILSMLADGERPAGDFVDALPITQPTVSKHLSVLREAGLVTVRKDAQRRLYSLNPAPLKELDMWLAPYRRFWTDRLDALEAHLDKEFPQ